MSNVNELSSRKVFESLYEQPLTDKELFSIEQNLKGFFNLLIEIERKQERRNK